MISDSRIPGVFVVKRKRGGAKIKINNDGKNWGFKAKKMCEAPPGGKLATSVLVLVYIQPILPPINLIDRVCASMPLTSFFRKSILHF